MKRQNQEYQKSILWKASSLILMFLYSAFSHHVNAQYIFLTREEKTLKKLFQQYDSTLLVTTSALMHQNPQFLGLLFKGNDKYYVEGNFKIKNHKVKRKRVNLSKQLNDTNIQPILKDLYKIVSLNKDSLENMRDNKTGKTIKLSDGNEYYVLVIYKTPPSLYEKFSYKINMYQSVAPNTDRAFYIEVLKAFETLCECKIITD